MKKEKLTQIKILTQKTRLDAAAAKLDAHKAQCLAEKWEKR